MYRCYMTDREFESLGDAGCQYLVRYHQDSDVMGFRKAVHERYYMRSYSAVEENPRIIMVEQQAQMFIVMAYVLLCILPLAAVVLISIIISRKVKSEQRMLARRKISFRTKFVLRSLLGNPMRSFVVLLGVFLGCFIMLLGQGFLIP